MSNRTEVIPEDILVGRIEKSEAAASIGYYQRHAERFFQETIRVDMRPLYQRFLPLLPAGGRILDAGCGSGRDLLAFRELGFQTTGFDASPSLVALASEHLGEPVHCLNFRDIPWHDEFHGIWACASLLHIPRSDLAYILKRLAKALISSGILYASFKYGTTEREKDGRFFTDMDESTLAALLDEVAVFAPLDIWITADQRPGRDDERWLNALLRKVDNPAQD